MSQVKSVAEELIHTGCAISGIDDLLVEAEDSMETRDYRDVVYRLVQIAADAAEAAARLTESLDSADKMGVDVP